MLNKKSKIYVAGYDNFMGGAIIRKLDEMGYKNLLFKKVDLLNQKAVEGFFEKEKPEYVFLPQIKSGGILANTKYPADFIYQNLVAQANIINAAFKYGAKKLLFLASSCSYPKICRQPIREENLLTSPLEPTNEPYAVAKISGIKMCQAYNNQHKTNFISAIPTNAYGPLDDFSDDGHVIASLIKKFHSAKNEGGAVKIWGTGRPRREFLYIDDVAEACIFLMKNYNSSELTNIAGGKEVSIKELAERLKKITNFEGKIIYETEKPDGMPRRILDSTKIFALGWHPKISLKEGLKLTYQWYKNNC